MSREIRANHEQTQSIMAFMTAGYDSYISARTLLREGQLMTGAIATAECIEKYLKAIILVSGKRVQWIHLDDPSLIKKIGAFDENLIAALDESFLQFLGKCYALRYPDNLKDGYRIVINQRRTLAHLDFSVNRIERSFEFHGTGGRARKIENDLQAESASLLQDNYLLLGLEKVDFIARPGRIYEMRVHPERGRLEVNYETADCSDSEPFTREGLIPS